MPRLVKKTAKGPIVIGDKHICMCGLSDNQPYCDGSHKKVLQEDDNKLYWYVDGKAEEILTESHDRTCHHGGNGRSQDGEEGCCGGQCQH
ncbi:MAG: Iron sulfur protein [uncultured bacterium]|uniref:Iron-binding zinc finger CDGSH type domain-containing protein n=2 Tax=Microgenomates group TaxID=1794810 RepID=A0A0G1LF28_9BACT|nr:MAG: Iron sulfur protein [uncultured bacterium]KKT30728.1 MAG: hypothetical protein UW16_C0006G0019 [Microgenomates group bacterium GW2011_GWC1_44_10]KKT49655.1 MAG: hypothetical protein UW41_C0003G0022 [Candidatus Collierbacteria bacterium GW2011_GWC2_44_18]KKT67262.1 MAG: hypothetical protein UW60_C0010G0025 [Candidatus Woesebacteria bacterium GW2011_GWA2_44_33]